VAHIFIQSPHVDYEAFQYFSFDFDGEDLVIASRTALQIENRKPPRGHDSNLITFHRIAGFRALLSGQLKTGYPSVRKDDAGPRILSRDGALTRCGLELL
jgi:hypothetical protein